jgi:hypothetical protein
MVVMDGSVPCPYGDSIWRTLCEDEDGSIGIAFDMEGHAVRVRLDRDAARRLGAALARATERPATIIATSPRS